MSTDELPPPTGPAVGTESPEPSAAAGGWAPPSGPAASVLSTPATRRGRTRSDSTAWVFASVVIGIVVLILIGLAIVSAVMGPGSSGGRPGLGSGVELTPATREVSATLLSGYDRRGKPVTDDGAAVLAASVRIENPTGEQQQYFVRVRFTGSDGERLAGKRLSPLVGPGDVWNRNVFTDVTRPSGDVSVTVSADRSDPLSLMP